MAEPPEPEVAERATRRTYSAQYKLRILAEDERRDRDGKGALLRRDQLRRDAHHRFASGQEINLEATRHVATVFNRTAALGPARSPLQRLQMPVGRCRNGALAEPATCVVDGNQCVRSLMGVDSHNDQGQCPRFGIELTRPTGGHACIEAMASSYQVTPDGRVYPVGGKSNQSHSNLCSQEVSQPTGYRHHDIHAKKAVAELTRE